MFTLWYVSLTMLYLLNNKKNDTYHYIISPPNELKEFIGQLLQGMARKLIHKRYLYNTQEEELTTVKCSRCHVCLTKPIYVCPDGHVVCEDCKYKYSCAICNQCVDSTRNVALEKLSRYKMYPCRWNPACPQYTYYTIFDHEYNCRFRRYNCPFTFCNFNSDIVGCLHHLQDDHPYAKLHLSHNYTSKLKQDQCWIMIAYQAIMYCKFTMNRRSAEWGVHVVGTFANARELEVHLYVGGVSYKLKLVNYFGPKFEVDVPYEVIPKAEKFQFTLTVIKQCAV